MKRYTPEGIEIINNREMHELLSEKIPATTDENIHFIARSFLSCIDNLKQYSSKEEIDFFGDVMEPEEREKMLTFLRKCID